ncbi:MAG TPA: acyl-CoA dehydrogenase, partial [Amycolatopsis sp.]
MTFTLDPAQLAFAADVRRLAAEQLLPLAESGVEGAVNRPLLKAMGALGLLARLFPGVAEGKPS